MNKKTIRDVDLEGKRVLVRVDYNVPLNDRGEVTDNTRIKRSLPTLKYLLEKDARIILMSHLGRPKGQVVDKYRLDSVARELESLLGVKVKKMDAIYSPQVAAEVRNMKEREIILLENLRFDPGEEKNDDTLARNLASLADIYVNDAFGAAHRAHASVVGVTRYLPSVAGFLMESELKALYSLLKSPQKPFVVILGGSKVSDKLKIMDRFLEVADALLIGGGMCFTFLKAQGYEIGRSICEQELVSYCRDVLAKGERNRVKILLPEDLVVADGFKEDASYATVNVGSIPPDWMGLDIGPRTADKFCQEITEARTVFWNGPMGVFEWGNFEGGTRRVAEAVAQSEAYTVAGGGDTLAAIGKYGVEDQIDHISTGGGASLELLGGESLPGVEALEDSQ
ncbi:phosphoglycerate kinase [Candidatus Hakubella thermalkaliphila]|uniref:Phosphoglycerate kinase n=1 Tax=Candidatus Hakubella thermalkaliphila TaxID=2754717 RepID=A0A6V8Q4T0_9ACTN|nr:phosphoglycerate kinase [Candidatus Hakubella thermalkaliphila]GFP18602.1 phosphoglycerate kinase [Candidatus Hakubella thermalkaliphila]GFP23320.1 phosphoglycerate kinase [Candidatus Hakubella thermalkaliphila]GFP29213.1 phosphoglycerate kinase [Candidatus Hakubella thermalkaliphila]GFP39779.1 phosphoglycerate kinase [Candidatus Hakubella thermalkaliphila]